MIARWEALIFLAAFLVVLAWRFARGKNPFYQMLSGDRADGSVYLSPGRMQLLAVTTLFFARYMSLMLHDSDVFPRMSSGYLWALGASQVLYLLGKTHAIIFNSSILHRKNAGLERRDS